MAKTNFQDPGSGEIISPHVSGLQEAINKIEESLGMDSVAETDITLSELYISEDDRYRIFQAPAGKRNWLNSPAPVIKKNGVTISTGFAIDYGGGSVIFNPPLISTDTVTASFTRTKNTSGFNAHLADIVTEAAPYKILKLDENGKLPTSITGDANTVSGKSVGNASGQIPLNNGIKCIGLNAEKVNGIQLRIEAGRLQYHDGVDWKDIGTPYINYSDTEQFLHNGFCKVNPLGVQETEYHDLYTLGNYQGRLKIYCYAYACSASWIHVGVHKNGSSIGQVVWNDSSPAGKYFYDEDAKPGDVYGVYMYGGGPGEGNRPGFTDFKIMFDVQ